MAGETRTSAEFATALRYQFPHRSSPSLRGLWATTPAKPPWRSEYIVFNVEPIDGLPEHYYGKPAPRTETVQRIERAESFFAATGAKVVHGGSRASYVLPTDNVHMPCIDFFRDAESYYATRAHETAHNVDFRIMPCRTSRRPFGQKTGNV